MTSTPVSLNDESLNGSWIDINSASQIHSPIDNDSPEFLSPPYSLAESVQSLGIISFQVERFLQEAQRNQNSSNSLQSLQQNATQASGNGGVLDDNSGIYMSDSEINSDTGPDGIAIMNNLRKYQLHKKKPLSNNESNNNINNNDPHRKLNLPMVYDGSLKLRKNGEGQLDQSSDSLSLLSRASALDDRSTIGGALDRAAEDFQDFDWLWDWTAQPEYFTGKEWKVYAPKQDYLMRQRQMYCANLNNRPYGGTLFSGEVISLLFLTNILSIIIGAGLTYSILMRKS